MSASFRVPLMILVVYFMSLCAGAAAVQAQTSPDVSLTCDQPAPIEVYPGALRSTIIYCTLSNPTTFSEKVDLTYQEGIISVAGPGSATVPPGDTSFQVAARADLRQPEGQQVVTITATVTQWNGAPVSSATSPTEAKVMTSSEYSVRSEGVPNYQVQVMTIYIRGVYLPGFELVGTTMMAALAGAAVGRNSSNDELLVDDDGNVTPLDNRLF